MPGDSPFDQDQVLLRENLEDAQVFDRYLLTAIAACHAHAFEYLGRERGSADRARRPAAVVLTVGLVVNPAEAVAFDNALEAFAFGDADRIDGIAFSKNVCYVDFFAKGFADAEVAEFNDFSFRRGACFLEMAQERLGCIFFFGLAKAELNGRVAVGILGFYLGDNTGACFNNCASHILTGTVIDAGHPDFFTN